jgi:hypothetical protein
VSLASVNRLPTHTGLQDIGAASPAYHIFNYGFSPWGAALSSAVCTHKATKTGLAQLNTSLRAELRTAGVTGIGVHNLSPGMVLTDLLLKVSCCACVCMCVCVCVSSSAGCAVHSHFSSAAPVAMAVWASCRS